MIKIDGLEKLQRDLEQAQVALERLDGELCSVSFDPNDPASIENAIQEVARVIDERVGIYSSNPFVAPLIEQMKDSYRENILQKASEARLTAGDSE